MEFIGFPAGLRIKRIHKLPEEQRSHDPDQREADARAHERRLIAEIADARIAKMIAMLEQERASLREYIMSITDTSEVVR